MTMTTLSELRRKLDRFCERTVADREPIRVRRGKGEDVVLLPADEFASLVETAHLLASPENARRLLQALARGRRKTVKPMTVEELRAAVGV